MRRHAALLAGALAITAGVALAQRDGGRPQGPPPGQDGSAQGTGSAQQAEGAAPQAGRYGLPPLWSRQRPSPGPEPMLVLAGRAVAAGEGLAGAWACHSCHGLEGAGNGAGAFPRLAGQGAWYLYKQLGDYAAGTRFNHVMTPIAQGMTDAQMQAVAAWYAAQEQAPWPPRPAVDARVLQRGAALHAVGAPERGVTACANCHGEQAWGMGPSYPQLAGQYADYLILQLHLWKRGERRNSPLGVMAQVAAGMTEEEIEAVSLYHATLRPGAPR